MKTVFVLYRWYGDGDSYAAHSLLGVFSSEEKAIEGHKRIGDDDVAIYLPSDNLDVGSCYYTVNKGEMVYFSYGHTDFYEIKEVLLDEPIRI